MKRILRWWRRRQLRLAHEQYAMWKAKREMLEKTQWGPVLLCEARDLSDAAAEEARYMERVEQLMRE